MATPRVSVVVPTHNRPELLERLLSALESQTLGPERFETVVVDDGSTQPFRPGETGFDLRTLRHERARGPAAARNTGWRAARGALVAFTDDDCRPSAGWLAEMIAAWDGDESIVVQGCTQPDLEHHGELHPTSRTMRVEGLTGLYETCNIAYSRSLLCRVGGFDERFRRACGEDVDLGLRTSRAGAALTFASGALVFHVVQEPPFRARIRQARIWSDAVLTLKLHPELRTMLVAGLFWKRTHPLFMVAAAGALSGARHRSLAPALLAAAPYLEHYRRLYAKAGQSLPKMLRQMPAHVVVDATEVATMIEGTVRHRTVML